MRYVFFNILFMIGLITLCVPKCYCEEEETEAEPQERYEIDWDKAIREIEQDAWNHEYNNW